jgi:hypothetical protein
MPGVEGSSPSLSTKINHLHTLIQPTLCRYDGFFTQHDHRVGFRYPICQVVMREHNAVHTDDSLRSLGTSGHAVADVDRAARRGHK